MRSKATDRALDILFALARAPEGGVTLSALAREVRLPKSTTVRLLANLEHHGLATRTAGRRLIVGFATLYLAEAFHRHIDLGRRSRGFLRALRDKTRETAALYVALGDERACIEKVESDSDIKWVAEIGKRFPLLSGSPGKVFAAYASPAERAALLATARLRRLTPHSITEARAFEREVARVRRQGYALSINETVLGASAVAAPVRDRTGRVIAVLTVAGPSMRLPRTRLVALSGTVMKTAAALSREYGWNGAAVDAGRASDDGSGRPPRRRSPTPRRRGRAARH